MNILNTSRAKPMHQEPTKIVIQGLAFSLRTLLELMGVVAVFVAFGFMILVTSMHFFRFPITGKLVVVRSGSMEPAVPLGSLVWLQPQSDYAEKQVVAYTHPDSNNAHTVVLHRIHSKSEKSTTTFRTKGDANDSQDAFSVSQDNIIGAMKFQISYAGFVVAWLQTQVGVLCTVIFPLI